MDVCGRFDNLVADCIEIPRNNTTLGQKFSDRLKSFNSWPVQMKQPPKVMAEAGFIYTGQSDKVYCFQCALRAHSWIAEDDPFAEHFRLSPHCTYIHMVSEPKTNKEG